MLRENKILRVFEHQKIRLNNHPKLTETVLEQFQEFYGTEGVPYFKLIHKGVQFTEYVGVIQVGDLTVEVLPKPDKDSNLNTWHEVLIQMLNTVGFVKVHAPSSSSLQLQSNSILDLYFELFVAEVEYLIHRGLIKKYRRIEKNSTALKGPIQFSKHIQQNVVHQERFYIRETVYDQNHKIHKILFKTISVLKRINTNSHLLSRLGALELNFPEVDNISISNELFNFSLNRKTQIYEHALAISKLILLNYHPDVRRGQNNVLALMFDMNLLWERFVYKSLQKHLEKNYTLQSQNTKNFWKPNFGSRSQMRPDIVINKGEENCVVLDTKWKNLGSSNPNPDDLRQLYVYNEYYNARKVALIYPSSTTTTKAGFYYEKSVNEIGQKECAVISIKSNQNINQWQYEIAQQLKNWINNIHN